MPLPPAIDGALTRLGLHQNVTPAIQSLMVSIFRNLMRAFDDATGFDRDALAKVRRRIEECTRLAAAAVPTSADAAVLPDLTLLVSLLAGDGAAAPVAAVVAVPVVDDPRRLAPSPRPPPIETVPTARRPAAPRAGDPAPAPARVRPRPAAPPAPDPAQTEGLAERLQAKLAALSERREALLADPTATALEIESLDREIANARRAAPWIGAATPSDDPG